MKVFNFTLLILFTLAVYSQSADVVLDDGDTPSTGRKGLARERIQHFEEIIRSNGEAIIPELKTVKRTRPLIPKFPIEGTGLTTRVDYTGETPEHVLPKDDDKSTEDDEHIFDYVDPVSSDIDVRSDAEDTSPTVTSKETEESKTLDGEFSTDVSQAQTGDFGADSTSDLSIHTDDKSDLSTSSTKAGFETVEVGPMGLTKNQKKKLEKEKLKNLKLEKKLAKQKENDRLKQEKKDKKMKRKEEKLRLKEEKERLRKEKKAKTANKKEVESGKQKSKSPDVTLMCMDDDNEDNSSCSSKKKKHKIAPVPAFDETLEERLNNQVISDNANEEVSTVASENEVLDNMSSVSEAEYIEEIDHDIKVEKPKEAPADEIQELDDVEEDREIKARILAGNENDFKTERLSSEEMLQDNDSDYLEGEDNNGESKDKYRFSGESDDLISREKAVEPLEGIEIEGFSEGDDDDVLNVNEVQTVNEHSGDNEEEDDNLTIEDLSSGVDLSKDDNLSEDQVQATNLIDDEEIEVEEREKQIDEDFSVRESNAEEAVSENNTKSFFDKFKSFFMKKPSLNCKGPACMKRFSRSDEPKYSADFIPRIYLLSRSIPKENFYRIPDIVSNLRSESNRLVFAYQLIDGSLIPSSSLALSSKSFIARRWGKNVQLKLKKLRSEFDSLKARLSLMYHEGVIQGEFELLIEEIDDLTIMLYLLAREFPSKTNFANTARDILRYPEVVSTPGERLASIFRKSKVSRCYKKSTETKPERSESEKLAIKRLKKRMKFIKKRLSSLSK